MRILTAAIAALMLTACFPDAVVPDGQPQTSPAPRPIVTYAHDSDYSADPPSQGDRDRQASFAETVRQAQAAAAQGQGGYYGKSPGFEKSAQCEALHGDVESKKPSCATELLGAHCGRPGRTYDPIECPDCAVLAAAQKALADAGCPNPPSFPPLRVN